MGGVRRLSWLVQASQHGLEMSFFISGDGLSLQCACKQVHTTILILNPKGKSQDLS